MTEFKLTEKLFQKFLESESQTAKLNLQTCKYAHLSEFGFATCNHLLEQLFSHVLNYMYKN